MKGPEPIGFWKKGSLLEFERVNIHEILFGQWGKLGESQQGIRCDGAKGDRDLVAIDNDTTESFGLCRLRCRRSP